MSLIRALFVFIITNTGGSVTLIFVVGSLYKTSDINSAASPEQSQYIMSNTLLLILLLALAFKLGLFPV